MKYLLTLFMMILTFAGFSQNYSKVKIYTDQAGLQTLANAGLPVDHGNTKANEWFITDLSEKEILILESNGFQYDVLVKDVKADFLEKNQIALKDEKNANCSQAGNGSLSLTTPSNFNLGTMGGYLKYNEMLAELDAMAAQYPNLITVKAAISTYQTFEGRPIYYVKISDNPTNDEVPEPKILYTAIHHAREPMSMMTEIYYMWYLLENYSSNAEVKYIVDNTQMFFVPCLNPDGYIYNETTDPNGGGMWRKNRRDNGGGDFGVDLNRNYAHGWNTTGTSTDPSSDVYCGTSAFSEPETQAIKWFTEQHDFKFAFNCHTYGNDILFPIGTNANVFADHHDYFVDETGHMCKYNGYNAMKSSGLYEASGDSDDWMYMEGIGVGQKDTIFAHTPEIGTSFWPTSNEIIPTCEAMFFPNIVLAHLSLKYLVVDDASPSMINTLNGNFDVEGQRLGLKDGAFTVSIEPLLNIVSVGPSINVDLDLRESFTYSFAYDLNPAIQSGDLVKYVILTDNGTWIRRDTIIKTFNSDTPQVFENGSAANWSGSWGLSSSQFYSASTSYTDSPTGNYTNNNNKSYTYVPVIDLSNVSSASVSYYAKWETEDGYDYCQFQVSNDGGATWIAQCGVYTNPGTADQAEDEPLYDGVQNSWVLEQINLSDYVGQNIKFRFVFKSDFGTNEDGFYFDDFTISYSIDESALNELSNPLKVFPNPSKGIINVVGFDQNEKIQLFDLSGKVVFESQTNQSIINIENLSNGIYYLKTKSQGNVYNVKIELFK